MKYEINTIDQAIQIEILPDKEKIMIQQGKNKLMFDAVRVQPEMYSVLMNNRSFVVGVCSMGKNRVTVNGTPISLQLLDAVHLHLRELGWESMQETKAGLIETQIPGLITQIFHQVGDMVNEGEPLFLMEAMKMENEIKAPLTGRISKISVKEGQTVDKGTNIMEIG
ncbi:MAG: acetyl-CoA carboxylase biotin carboxyl carrier protein subunit [Candidatus Marinimicrobia bacterium]|nr:acetyl-CoA carboxylase biotin carboxyl carrier protein subunit [Candidatus Neomarinimicrobiota bacterium]